MRRIFVMVIVLSLALASFGFAAEVWEYPFGPPTVGKLPKYVPTKIVVKFEPAIVGMLNRASARHGVLGIPHLDALGASLGVASVTPQFSGAKKKIVKGRGIDFTGWHVIKFQDEVDLEGALAAYRAMPGVLIANPVRFLTLYQDSLIPNDQFYQSANPQWYLPHIKADLAWTLETGNPQIIVAVPDSGVRYYAKDMGGPNASYDNPSGATQGNMWINNDPVNDSDDDGNGFVDDWIGWDFVDAASVAKIGLTPTYGEDAEEPDNDPRDFNGHGTACASIIGAMTNNWEAMAGVAGGWGDGTLNGSTGNGAKVMPLRIFWSVGGLLVNYIPIIGQATSDTDLAAQALYYASDNGARLASLSFGADYTPGPGDPFDLAINYFLYGSDTPSGDLVRLIVAAAGNRNPGTETLPFPASRSDIISVGAIDEGNVRPNFSNYGYGVDIVAPGTNIWALIEPPWPLNDVTEDIYSGPFQGTSLSCPLVAGVAALMWSRNPSLPAVEIRDKLLQTCDPISEPDFPNAGLVNAYAAVTAVAPVNQTAKAGVDELVTGRYERIGKGRDKRITFVVAAPATFTQGEEVVFRARVIKNENGSVTPLAGATVDIEISGPENLIVNSEPSVTEDGNAYAYASWKTQAPIIRGKKSKPGTPTGTYTAKVKGVIAEGCVWDDTKTSTSFDIVQ